MSETLEQAETAVSLVPSNGSVPKQSVESGGDARVVAHFDSAAPDWQRIYSRRDVWGIIHQDRLCKAIGWVKELGLLQGSRVLDAGCGAGLATLAFAQQGYEVEAIDAAPGMVALTQQHAVQSGLEARIKTRVAGIYNLPFASRSFPLAVSLGVIPWLEHPQDAVAELSRVLQPGGYLLFTADNKRRLPWLLDPFTCPALKPIKNLLKKVLGRTQTQGWEGICSHQHSVAEIDKFLLHAGMKRLRLVSFGFGPFTFAYRKALPDRLGVGVHDLLQRLADAGLPGIRSVGAQYLILAQKDPA